MIFGDSGSMLTLQNLKLTIACYYIKTLSQLSNAFTLSKNHSHAILISLNTSLKIPEIFGTCTSNPTHLKGPFTKEYTRLLH